MSVEVKTLVEAALFMAGRSVSVRELSEVVGASAEDVKAALELLASDYASRGGGVALEWNGKSAHMHVPAEIEDRIMSIAPATHMNKAMLKTLAIIATEGPVKKSDLVKARGTRVYYYAKRLLDEGLISARKAGRTQLLSTTPKFNQYFKIKEVPKAVSSEPQIEEVGEAVESEENHVEFQMK